MIFLLLLATIDTPDLHDVEYLKECGDGDSDKVYCTHLACLPPPPPPPQDGWSDFVYPFVLFLGSPESTE